MASVKSVSNQAAVKPYAYAAEVTNVRNGGQSSRAVCGRPHYWWRSHLESLLGRDNEDWEVPAQSQFHAAGVGHNILSNRNSPVAGRISSSIGSVPLHFNSWQVGS